MKVQVHTTLKEGVLDPQGKAVESALENLGFNGINKIRQGKLFDIDLETNNKEEAEKLTKEISFNFRNLKSSIEQISLLFKTFSHSTKIPRSPSSTKPKKGLKKMKLIRDVFFFIKSIKL